MIIARTLTQTTEACPSQWEGTTDDGLVLYVRYRDGWLHAGVGPTMDAAIDTMMPDGFPALEQGGYAIFSAVVGEEYDGVMTTWSMLYRLREVMRYEPADALRELEFGGITTEPNDPKHIQQVISHIAHLEEEQVTEIRDNTQQVARSSGCAPRRRGGNVSYPYKYKYSDRLDYPDELSFGAARSIEDSIAAIGTAKKDRGGITFEVEADDLWDLRGMVEEILAMLATHGISYLDDREHVTRERATERAGNVIENA